MAFAIITTLTDNTFFVALSFYSYKNISITLQKKHEVTQKVFALSGAAALHHLHHSSYKESSIHVHRKYLTTAVLTPLRLNQYHNFLKHTHHAATFIIRLCIITCITHSKHDQNTNATTNYKNFKQYN
jgi:hypothetical protein